jgi:hypothetical protein
MIHFINTSKLMGIFFVRSQVWRMRATLLALILGGIFSVWPKSDSYNHWLLIPNYLASVLVAMILFFSFSVLTNFFIWLRILLGKIGWLLRWEPDMSEYQFPDWITDKKKRRKTGIAWMAAALIGYLFLWIIETYCGLKNPIIINLLDSISFLILIFGSILLITRRV